MQVLSTPRNFTPGPTHPGKLKTVGQPLSPSTIRRQPNWPFHAFVRRSPKGQIKALEA